MEFVVHRINLSGGGVPKRPVEQAQLGREGFVGDWQNDRKHHGGPERAVCLYALSLIELLRSEGHPIEPGSVGENLTIGNLTPEQWGRLAPGAVLRFDGGAVLQLASYCAPCATIRDSFKELNFKRIKQELHPGMARLYARVLAEGTIRSGERGRIAEPAEVPSTLHRVP